MPVRATARERREPRARRRLREREAVRAAPMADLMALQSEIGNRGVTTLLRSALGGSRSLPLRHDGALGPGPHRSSLSPRPSPTRGGPSRGVGGRTLPPPLQSFFGPRLGEDFSDVRIHTGSRAARQARALHARAFTIGSDVVFGAGEYAPSTRSGRRLLAHELVHVAQQRRSGTREIQRQPRPDEPEWHRQLDEILPGGVGLVTHIMRMQQLYDRFTEAELRALVTRIHASSDAIAFVHYGGVPGMFALEDTRVGDRLDVGAARFLLRTFPARRRTPRASEEESPEVFSEEVVRDAYIRFHYNALLPRNEESFAADLPREVRKNCILIVRDMLPRLFSDPDVVRRVRARLRALRGSRLTMGETGEVLEDVGVAGRRPIELRFVDAAGRETNGNTEPAEMNGSAWDQIMAAVGDTHGWHIFGMAVMDGHHSVTLFVDNQPGDQRLYWADQWFIDRDFQHMPNAISGFRRYDKAGLDGWLEELTRNMWRSVHNPDSKCAERAGARWDRVCRYNTTVTIWHLRKVARRRRRRR